jgi:hypothetical protein
VRAVTITVNTFHFSPIAAIEPTTHSEATPTGNKITTAGSILLVNAIRTINDTINEIIVDLI